MFCATRYEEAMTRLLTRYKFHGETGWHLALSALLIRILREERRLGALRVDAVAAVPLHAARRRERGYNQAGFLAADVAAKMALPDLSTALMRVANTRRQTETSDRSGRFSNVSGAFFCVGPKCLLWAVSSAC